jgi:branched-chain amino acid transport system ATP-binding protein
MTARHLRSRQWLADAVIGTPRHRREERRTHERARELLAIFGLDALADEMATNLPYGSQRRLEIARALATEPKLLLLDEPAAGMNPQESLDLMNLIRWIRDEFSLTILLVEHNMKVVMGICEQIQVIDYGEAIAFGTPAEIQRDPAVIAAYLGGH